MDGLFADEPFLDFGPIAWMPGSAAPQVELIRAARSSGLRGPLRTLCPAKPGVYGMLDAAGELIYVGKAKQLRLRLASYFRPHSRPPKATRVLREARAIVWEVTGHEFAALLREQELIRRWRPRLNIQGQPLRRRLAFVCVGRAPAPYVFLTRQPPASAVSFGPVHWTERTAKAIQRLNDHFRLRDCPQSQTIVFADERGLYSLALTPGCVRAELATCSAPCAGLVAHAEYAAQVQSVLRFLGGDSDGVVAALERRMHEAAQTQQFERAGVLRDQWNDFAWLGQQLARQRQAQQEMSFVYPVTGWDRSVHWFLIHGARVLTCVPAPSDSLSARQSAVALEAAFDGKRLDQLLTPYEHHDGRLIVMHWFRQRPRELRKTLTPEQARAKCHRWAPSKSA